MIQNNTAKYRIINTRSFPGKLAKAQGNHGNVCRLSSFFTLYSLGCAKVLFLFIKYAKFVALSLPSRRRLPSREFKKLQRQLQGKRHIKIELCVKLSLLRLSHVDHVVHNRRSAFLLD